MNNMNEIIAKLREGADLTQEQLAHDYTNSIKSNFLIICKFHIGFLGIGSYCVRQRAYSSKNNENLFTVERA